MSHHEIEDFIEQAIKLIDISAVSYSKKKTVIQGILSLQGFFDCSDISSRFSDILEKYDCLKVEHFLEFSAPNFFHAILIIFRNENNYFLMKSCYALFVNCIIEKEFGLSENISEAFKDWIKDSDLLAIRKVLEAHPEISKQENKDKGMLSFPDIAYEKQLVSNFDELIILSFIGEPKKNLEEIIGNYKKEISKKHIANPGEIIHTYFLNTLGQKIESSKAHINISKAGYKETEVCLSFGKHLINGEDIYVNLYIVLNGKEGWISCYVGVQYSEILAWQQQTTSNEIKKQHTLHNLIMYLDNDDFKGNKYINSLGVWKYSSTQSEKKLKDTCQNIIDMYQKHHDTILDTQILRIQYFQKLSSLGDFLKEIQAFEDLMMIPIEKDLPFANRYDIIYYLIYFHTQNGNTLLAQEYETYIRNLGKQELSSKILQRNKDFLQNFNANGAFPDLINIKNITLL